jgi:hypothetical protein
MCVRKGFTKNIFYMVNVKKKDKTRLTKGLICSTRICLFYMAETIGRLVVEILCAHVTCEDRTRGFFIWKTNNNSIQLVE